MIKSIILIFFVCVITIHADAQYELVRTESQQDDMAITLKCEKFITQHALNFNKGRTPSKFTDDDRFVDSLGKIKVNYMVIKYLLARNDSGKFDPEVVYCVSVTNEKQIPFIRYRIDESYPDYLKITVIQGHDNF